ncbi:MAG: hypothetical protein M5U01_30055 [Ardenticatenaceae bacterium]|nr:hypothetical protein [Ardenticatenaceae bacterium]
MSVSSCRPGPILIVVQRLADTETFDPLALVAPHRRGVETAGPVAAVLDGAEWVQGFVDWHRPDAVRLRDFPHAAGYVGKIGQATVGAESPDGAAWLQSQLHHRKHTGPDAVLATLHDMVAEHPQAEALDLPQAWAYLDKRKAQRQEPVFQAQGWPIASGATESGNQLVVEARLKGAGRHWAPAHVDPMLALRNVVGNDRWDEAWPQIAAELRQQAREPRTARRQRRRAATQPRRAAEATSSFLATETPPPALEAVAPADTRPGTTTDEAATAPSEPPPPAANHPWRRGPACLSRPSSCSYN